MLGPLTQQSTTQTKRIESSQYVEGYATTFGKPYLLYDFNNTKIYERIEPTALDTADLSDVIMQYDHHGKVLARTGNNTLGLITDSHGLLMYSDLSKSTAAK